MVKLQTKSRVKVEELADTYGVSRRTIYRDLRSLQDAGVPIVQDEKGYNLIEGYHLPPISFTETEANALITAERFILKTTDASLIEEFSSAIDKIKSVLKGTYKEKVDLLSRRTIIGKNWQNVRTSAYLPDIQLALTNFLLLKMHYKKEGQNTASNRLVEPFAIYHNTSEHWVMIAWCRLRAEFRNFRVDRITALKVLEEKFTPHKLSMKKYTEIQRQKYSRTGAKIPNIRAKRVDTF